MPRSQRDTAIADTFNRRAKSVWFSPIRFRNFSILAAHDGLATLAPDRTFSLPRPPDTSGISYQGRSYSLQQSVTVGDAENISNNVNTGDINRKYLDRETCETVRILASSLLFSHYTSRSKRTVRFARRSRVI